MKKVIILHNYIVPHAFPLLRELNKSKKIALQVFYLSESAKNRRWKLNSSNYGFRYKILPSWQINFFGKDLFTYIINPTIIWEFIKNPWDIVICDGWLDFSCQISFFVSKFFRKKYVLWSESTINEPSWRRSLAMPLVKMIVRHADAILARGTLAKEYLISLGANEQKIFISPCVVDVDYFYEKSRISDFERKKLKKRLGIEEKSLVILYSGQLIKRKGLEYLLDAFYQLSAKYADRITLLIQGYGPEKENLGSFCSEKKIKNVVFSDHVEAEEIPKIYALGDVFVLPSYEETWGRVVNEAMACGLPVITTKKVGSWVDMVKNGVNGFVVQEKNSSALEKAMELLIENEDLRKKMGEESLKITGKYFTPALAANGALEAIRFVS